MLFGVQVLKGSPVSTVCCVRTGCHSLNWKVFLRAIFSHKSLSLREKKVGFLHKSLKASMSTLIMFKTKASTLTWLGASGSEDKWWRLAAFHLFSTCFPAILLRHDNHFLYVCVCVYMCLCIQFKVGEIMWGLHRQFLRTVSQHETDGCIRLQALQVGTMRMQGLLS